MPNFFEIPLSPDPQRFTITLGGVDFRELHIASVRAADETRPRPALDFGRLGASFWNF